DGVLTLGHPLPAHRGGRGLDALVATLPAGPHAFGDVRPAAFQQVVELPHVRRPPPWRPRSLARRRRAVRRPPRRVPSSPWRRSPAACRTRPACAGRSTP